MILRVTLNNTIEGSHPITDPDGWKEINIMLERDAKYSSLVEGVVLPLIFYRSSDSVDGGYDYIRNVEDTQGPDAEITIDIECSDDEGETYEDFFSGVLELETLKDISDAENYKLECNIIRNDIWSKFMNRESQQVDVQSATSIGGQIVATIPTHALSLPCQKMRKISRFENFRFLETGFSDINYVFTIGTNPYGIIELPKVSLDEIKTKFNYFATQSPTIPFEMFSVDEAGSYNINFEIYVSTSPTAFIRTDGNLNVMVQINDDAAMMATLTQLGTNGIDGRTKFAYNATHDLIKGDFIRIYFQYSAALSPSYSIMYSGGLSGLLETVFIEITGDTIYPDSETEAINIADCVENILSKIVDRSDVLYSNYLGDNTPSGCGRNFDLMKGLHIRKYSFIEKPFFSSFNDWWDGANPILNLGLGYEDVAGTVFIRIEDKGHFYNDDPSITFNYVDKIVRTYDKDKILKSIKIGYQDWSVSAGAGIDTPQTVHDYNTRFAFIGKDESILSKFIAGDMPIEETRRNGREQNKDWRYDDKTIIIATNGDRPELNEHFTDIINLLNSSSRYNLGITPARNFERWKANSNGCLQAYVNNSPCEFYKFSSGEGNYDMVSSAIGDCDSDRIGESDDLCVTDDYYHTAIQFEFEVDLSWEDYKTIRDNRKKAILVSNTNTNHKTCFIDKMVWNHFDGKAKFTVWVKDVNFSW